jgi:hypothetical protein
MSQNTIENRLRDHYTARAAECVVPEHPELNEVVVMARAESTRWQPRGRILFATAAAAVVATVGLALVVSGADAPSPGNVPPTVRPDVQNQGGQRLYMDCLYRHGVAVRNTTADGGIHFTITGSDAVRKVAIECQRAIEKAGVPGSAP